MSRVLLLLVLATLVHARSARAGSVCAPVPAGLVGWWKLEGNGLDETGNHNGAAVGSGAFVAGIVGLGYAGNGAGNAVVVPHDAGLNVVNFTVDAWVRIDALPCINIPVVWKGSATGADITTPFSIGIYGTCERPSLTGSPFMIVSDGTLEQEVDGIAPITVGAWTHLAATADGTTLTLYVDGIPVSTLPQTLTPQFNTLPFQIGGVVGSGAVNSMPGTIDEVELHSQAATAAQIAAIYAAGSEGKCPLSTPAERTTWGSVKATYR
jgi:hypothetical protein